MYLACSAVFRRAVLLPVLENAVVPEAGPNNKPLFLEQQHRRLSPAFAFSLALAGKRANV
jgi:hypothetical protein